MSNLDNIFRELQLNISDRNVKFYRTKVIRSGEHLELEVFPMFKRSYARGQKRKVTKFFQACVNENNSRKQLTRLLNANFTDDDIWYDFTYEGEKPTIEEVKKEVQNFIRRLKRKFGDFKYAYKTEVGTRGTCRGHHHLICNIPSEYRDEVEEMWTKGRRRSRFLQADENGYEGVARYWCKGNETGKRYVTSKNLTKPTVKVMDNMLTRKAVADLVRSYEIGVEKIEKMRALKDFRVVKMHHKQTEYVAGSYVYVSMKRRI